MLLNGGSQTLFLKSAKFWNFDKNVWCILFLIKNNPYSQNLSRLHFAWAEIFVKTFVKYRKISPPTQSVGGSNSGCRGSFWWEIRCTKHFVEISTIFLHFNNFFTLFRNKVWNLPIIINFSFAERFFSRYRYFMYTLV